jgi:hypothetical protein
MPPAFKADRDYDLSRIRSSERAPTLGTARLDRLERTQYVNAATLLSDIQTAAQLTPKLQICNQRR